MNSVTQKSESSIAILQPVVPSYRVPVFRELKSKYGHLLDIYCGAARGSVATDEAAWDFSNRVGLTSFYGVADWQHGVLHHLSGADLVIVESNVRTPSTWLLASLRKQKGLPTVGWGHLRTQPCASRPIFNFLLRQYSGFIAYTKSDQATLRAYRPSLPVWCAHNACLSTTECRPSDQPLALIKDFVFCGRLVKEKKPMLAVTAFKIARDNNVVHPRANLIMIGDGEERARILQYVQKHNLESNVQLVGEVTRTSELSNYYASAVCSLSPGYVGLSAIQSFGFGVPMIVASSEPHSPEIEACNNRNTIYFESNDATRLAAAMEAISKQHPRPYTDRMEISKTIADNYSFEKMCNTFHDVIDFHLR